MFDDLNEFFLEETKKKTIQNLQFLYCGKLSMSSSIKCEFSRPD